MNESESQHPIIELTCFTDPYCTWCWGSEPIIGKIEETYGQQVKVSYTMGGLVEDIKAFWDSTNGIGGENWHVPLAEHWAEASQRHRMPVDEQVFYDIKDEWRSTYPASVAFEAAQLQGSEQGNRYLRRLRSAAAAERIPIHRPDIQLELASEIGLDLDRFRSDMESGAAESAFREDLAECRAKGVRGFPSYLIRGDNGREVLLSGYISFEAFATWFDELASQELSRNKPPFDLTTVYEFVSRKGKVAIEELSLVFDVDRSKVEALVGDLVSKDILNEQKTGSGSLYSTAMMGAACDSVTGVC